MPKAKSALGFDVTLADMEMPEMMLERTRFPVWSGLPTISR
jgi:hypothetical protein